jgi:cell division protein FtsW (lipid II flippase)
MSAAISSALFLLGIASLLTRRRRWSKADIALSAGYLLATICAASLLSAQYALLIAISALVMVSVSLVLSPLSAAQKWHHALIILAPSAAALALCLLLMPHYAAAGRDTLSQFFPGAATDPEFQQFLQNTSLDAADMTFKTSGRLFSVGGTLVFLAMLAQLIGRSLKVKDGLGKTLTLGISAIFAVRCLFFVLCVLGVSGTLSAGIPFISDGISFFLFNSVLVGVFLSVWRRSSFMRGQDDAVAIAVCQ